MIEPESETQSKGKSEDYKQREGGKGGNERSPRWSHG